MKTQKEISEWVKSSAQYLRELDLSDRLYSRPSIDALADHPDRSACFYDYDGFVSELQSIERDLNAAATRLASLRNHFSHGQMLPYGRSDRMVSTACANAFKALVEVGLAKHEAQIEHPPATRELYLQKSAVRLAAAMFDTEESRHVRSVAKRIMLEAGLDEPSPGTLTRWLNEVKD